MPYERMGKGFVAIARESPKAVSSSWYARFCNACRIYTDKTGKAGFLGLHRAKSILDGLGSGTESDTNHVRTTRLPEEPLHLSRLIFLAWIFAVKKQLRPQQRQKIGSTIPLCAAGR